MTRDASHLEPHLLLRHVGRVLTLAILQLETCRVSSHCCCCCLLTLGSRHDKRVNLSVREDEVTTEEGTRRSEVYKQTRHVTNARDIGSDVLTICPKANTPPSGRNKK